MSSSTSCVSPVPFSPVPGHHVDMKFDPAAAWTYSAAPLMEMAHERYRSAAIRLAFEEAERARGLAQDGIDFEDAYMARMQAEVKAGAR